MTGIPSDLAVVSLALKVSTGVAVKATVVLMGAGLLTLVLRRWSSAYKCAIWTTALTALLVLPVFSLVFPSWEITKIEVPRAAQSAAATAKGPAASVPGGSSPESPAQIVKDGGPASAAAGGVTQPAFNARYLAATLLLIIWFAGAAALFIRLFLHAWDARGIVRRAFPAKDPEISKMAAEVIAVLGIRRPVRLLLSSEISMPFTCGLRKPTVIFPASGVNWPSARRRSVLFHELAHVARWDYVLHVLIEVACALHWPNPAVWYAASRNAMERERACDDYALRLGTPSDVYATELLQIARSLVHAPKPAPAVTMAGTADLAGRVRNIMGKRINRCPISPFGMAIIVYTAAILTLPLAAVDVLGMHYLDGITKDVPSTRELIKDLRDDDDPLVRRKAAWWLGEHEDTRAVGPLVEDGLQDSSADVRLVSAWALGEIKDDDSIPQLISTLENDRDPLVREMAALALGEIENSRAVEALADAFDREEDLGLAIIWALGEIGSSSANRARESAFAELGRRPWRNDEVWTGRLKTKTFTVFGTRSKNRDCSKEIREELEGLMSKDPDDRTDAAFGIGRLGMSGCTGTVLAVNPLLETLRDPAPEVRAMAVWALDEINPSRWYKYHKDRDRDHGY
jgi:beta-lactamase regulating signal transducer with metallopeptidase domain